MGGTEGGKKKEEFVVEAILDKRLIRGKVEYLIKWEGYANEDNTWEPEQNCICPELMEAFEDSWAEKKKAERKNKQVKTKKSEQRNGGSNHENGGMDEDSDDDEQKRAKKKAKQSVAANGMSADLAGFDRGLNPEKIIGATDKDGELMFLIKWKNSDEADLVPARVANVRAPQMVISFYEERLTWHHGDGDEEMEEEDF